MKQTIKSYSQKDVDDYWAFHEAHPGQPCNECVKRQLLEMQHWNKQWQSEGRYTQLRASIQELLQSASPINRERLCIEHIQKQTDVFKLRDWYYHNNIEPYSELVKLAFLDQLQVIWNSTKPM